ncbi:aminotransferase class I/II-fold pyridoxal phosphate-dependent enzyme [Opitutales bacterium]|nr:aminotransferase class I/II-fold pyridoxal phosphate-dependent enzyme [Opitutales bacterium]
MPTLKQKISQLAKQAYHVGRPNMPDKEKVLSKFAEVLDSQWLTNMGPMSLELEERIASILGVKHCICVCNATIGLELLQRALNLKGEVIIPSFTFIATAHSLRWQRIEPVFCDVRMEDHLIDPAKIEALITPRTSAIMAVPIWGQPCNYTALQSIADKHGLKLIFDSAHAFGCKSVDQHLGGFGDAEVFSFHATKVFSTGEGGAITTNSDELAEKLQLMRNFGFTNYDKTEHIGTNAKMSELAAAYGLVHLDQLDSIIEQNKKIHQAYLDEFSEFQELTFLDYPFPVKSNYQYVVARVAFDIRDSLVDYFHAHSILLRRYFHPGCHRMEPYASREQYQELHLSNTDKISSEIVVFPTGTQVTPSTIKEFSAHFRKFKERNKL